VCKELLRTRALFPPKEEENGKRGVLRRAQQQLKKTALRTKHRRHIKVVEEESCSAKAEREKRVKGRLMVVEAKVEKNRRIEVCAHKDTKAPPSTHSHGMAGAPLQAGYSKSNKTFIL
jgi:hypothetical protein